MDYDPDWSNRDEVTQTQWQSPQQYSPSLYSNFKSHGNLHPTAEHSDTTYVLEGDPSHFPYPSNSLEDMSYCSYSPLSHLPNEMNRKYIPYPHQPLRYKDNSTHSSCHQFHRNIRLNTEQEAKKYCSQMCQHKLANMYPDPYLGGNYTTKTNRTALNIKKRRKTNESKSKRAKAEDSSNNTLENYTYEKLIINNNNPMQNCTSNSRYSTLPQVNQSTTGFDPLMNMFNRQPFVPENKDESYSVHKEHFTRMYISNNTNFKVENVDEIVSTSARDGYSDIKPIKEENFVNNELEVSDTVNLNIKNEINGRNAEHLDQNDASVQESTGNTNIQIKDSIQESFENVILQPIFEGKDEKGEDIIVLLVSSANHQEIPPKNSNMELNTDLSCSQLIENSEESIPLEEIPFQTSTGFQIEEDPENEIDSQQNPIVKSLNENYREPGLQIEGTDVFFSNINDFVSKEAEVAVGNKSSNTKRTKKKNCQLPSNKSPKKTPYQRKIHNVLSEDNSEATELAKQKLYAPLIGNCKKLKASYKPRKFKWKGNYQSKPKLQFKNFKNLFISEIKKLFKVKDVSANRNKTWELLKNQIGRSVLQSIFATFLQLSETETQKSKITISTRK